MQKMKCIQGIRGIAIFLIVLWHLNSVFPNCLPAFGDRGVEFFFLISGFLIGLKYYDSGKMNSPRQTLRYALIKGKKIYPLYLLTIVPMLVFLFKSWKAHEIGTVKLVSIIGVNLFYLQSWIPSEGWTLNGATWFLSDLLFCYLTIFIFFRIIRKIGSKSTIVMLFLIEFIWEFFVLNCIQNQVAFLTYSIPVYRALDFGIGIILGVLSKCKEKKNLDGMLALLLIVYVIMMVVFDKRFTYSIYHVVETLLVWTIVMGSGSISKHIFENSLLVKLGNISEVIFLTHLPVITYMRIVWDKVFGNQYRFVEWIVILLCIFVAAYSVSYIQKMIQVKKQCKSSL
jgi:peptidoglycan/LPS O-acetylase OafA/YrhL